jgi:hypothetical protein
MASLAILNITELNAIGEVGWSTVQKNVSEVRSRANVIFLRNVIIVTIIILGTTSILTFFLSYLTTPLVISTLWLIALLILLTEVLILYGNSQVDLDNIDISRLRRIWYFIVPVIVIILFLFVVLTIVIHVTSIVT